MRAIDADELLLRFIPRGGDNPFTRFVRETVRLRIEEMPTIEPKRGRWNNKVIYSDNKVALWCSECGKRFFKLPTENGEYNFCPNCGADMREVEEEVLEMWDLDGSPTRYIKVAKPGEVEE